MAEQPGAGRVEEEEEEEAVGHFIPRALLEQAPYRTKFQEQNLISVVVEVSLFQWTRQLSVKKFDRKIEPKQKDHYY